MANGNGNRQWTIWVAGILATIVLSALTMTIKSVVANDVFSRDRDEKIEVRIIDKVNSNQFEIRQELATLNTKTSEMNTRSMEFSTNQKWIMETLKEIKAK